MSSESQPERSAPYGMFVLLAIVGVLYVMMLSTISFSTGVGDASFGQAIASLFFTVGLWIALTVLIVAGGVMGSMPRSAVIAAIVLLPLSGVATFSAIDMCSRHFKWAVVFPVLLPILIAVYALWARLPRFRAAVPDKQMSIGTWGAVLALSVVAILAASFL
jgi:hypothetical protein